MSIVALPVFNDNYIWLIINETKHELTCVDPGEATAVIAYAKQNKLLVSNILITHHHEDHCGGVSELRQQFPNAQVYGPSDPRITPLINHPVHDEQIIHIDTLAFRIICTPGHTSSHVCYQEPTQGWLFCGDTLFSGGCGRVFDGTMKQLHHSITTLKNLPKDTQVFCGHEYTRKNLEFAATIEPSNVMIQSYRSHLDQNPSQCSLPSTIALEKQINPFMRISEPSIKEFIRSQGIISDDPLVIFETLRTLKNAF
jgi:hydroxyacylglutathione hydrolase